MLRRGASGGGPLTRQASQRAATHAAAAPIPLLHSKRPRRADFLTFGRSEVVQTDANTSARTTKQGQNNEQQHRIMPATTRLFEQFISCFHDMPPVSPKPFDNASILQNIETTPATKEQKQAMENLLEINVATLKHDRNQLSDSLKTIRSILERAHYHSFPSTTCAYSGDVPILDVTEASLSDLTTLLKVFKGDCAGDDTTEEPLSYFISNGVPDDTSAKRAADELSKFIPIAEVQTSPPKHESCQVCAGCSVIGNCDWCGQELCNHNPPRNCSYPRTGQVSSMLCSDCISYNIQKDTEDWEKASLDFLEEPSDTSIIASIGCALVAIALGLDSLHLLKKIAKKLHRHGNNKMAYRILQLALSKSEKGSKEETSILFLASSILKDLVKFEKFSVEEKRKLILAAKEAFSVASFRIEMPNGDELAKSIDSLILKQIEEDLKYNWKKDDVTCLFEVLNKYKNIEESICMQAFKTFLKGQETSVSAKDQVTLTLLKGVWQLMNGNTKSALLNFESATWNFFKSSLKDFSIMEPVVGAYMYMLKNHGSDLFSLEVLEEYLQPDLRNFNFTHDIQSLLSTSGFLASQPICFFPSNPKELEVANVYINEAKKCTNPAEVVICYLHAAVWMMKDFDLKSNLDSDTLFAFKSVVMTLLLNSYKRALDIGNPGLELYTTRIAISVIEKLGHQLSSQHVFTDDDHSFLRRLLQKLAEVMHLFPFWNPPFISLSEAGEFNRFTSLLHSEFIYELQRLKPEERQLKTRNLAYQLHRNGLFNLLPTKNLLNCRAKLMNEELKAQGLLWSDVTEAMSSQYCPRDKEGWIIPNPDLNLPSQYSQVVGFTLDVSSDKPALKLLVVKANPKTGRRGLFSLKDVTTILQLDADDEVFFSLDPLPNDFDKCHRLFQVWRYLEKTRNTELLKTMFLADYIMKSMIGDCDTSSLPPFKQRSCKDGLFNSLPTTLQEALRPIQERGFLPSNTPCHSWIELKELNYNEFQNDTYYCCHIGEVTVETKSELISHSNSDPNSPHLSFARDMTEKYAELSKHYPVFARLPELYKLQFFSFKLQSVIQEMIKHYPDKANTLQKFIKTFKQPSLPSGKCTIVPAFTSKSCLLGYHPVNIIDIQSVSPICARLIPAIEFERLDLVIYGGVQFCKNFQGTTSAPPFPEVGGPWKTTKEMFATGCKGNEELCQAFIRPNKILSKSALNTLVDISDPDGGDVQQCRENARGVIFYKDAEEACGTGKWKFKPSCDIFGEAKEHAKFSFVLTHENCTESDVNNSLSSLNSQLLNDHMIPNGAVNAIADSNEVGGVKLSFNVEVCRKNSEFCFPPHVTEVDSEAFLASNVLEVADQPDITQENYTPPPDIAMRQHTPSSAHFKSWNSTVKNERHVPNTSSNFSNTQVINSEEMHSSGISIVAKALHNIINGTSSAKKPLVFSFREENSPSLNKQIDRLTQIVFMEVPQLMDQ